MVHRHFVTAALLATVAACAGGPPLLEDDARSRGGARQATVQTPAYERQSPPRYTPPAPSARTVTEATPRRYEAPATGDAPAGSIEPDPYFSDETGPLEALDAPDAELDTALRAPTDTARVGAPDRVGAGGAPLPLRDLDQAPEMPERTMTAEALTAQQLDEVMQLADDAPDAEETTSEALAAVPPLSRVEALRRRPPAASAPTPRATDAFLTDPAAALAAINAYRASYGRAALSYNPVLSATARSHAEELARRGEVTALSTDGAGVIGRLDRAGYVPGAAASLVAGGYGDFADALASWQQDETERSRLLLPDATEIGIAMVEDRRSPYRYYLEAIVSAP